jgi:hypothetical protein
MKKRWPPTRKRPGLFRRFLPRRGLSAARLVPHAVDAIAEQVDPDKWGRLFFGRRDYVDPEMVVLNVKALGYELARALAERNLARRVEAPPDTLLASKLCTQADFDSNWFLFWAREVGAAPVFQRKLWEFCFIAQALWRDGMLRPGRSGLGFGCGQEPLPSLFAKYGANVLATDQPQAGEWIGTGQHAEGAERLRMPSVCPDESRLATIRFRAVDMKSVPPELGGQFDFCWSACAFEHLGSLDAGMRFVEASLDCLRPGSTAVHTTEFNLSNGLTIDHRNIVLYQKQHIVALADRLRRQGRRVAELDFSRGAGFMDYFVDMPPWTDHPGAQHLKLYIQGFPCTSFGLIIRT